MKGTQEQKIVLCLILDSRQNLQCRQTVSPLIVLCLILDSRQNFADINTFLGTIVLCLILDSRQNPGGGGGTFRRLYCALFWIQGKTLVV